MFSKHKTDLNIRCGRTTRVFRVKGQKLRITIKDALYDGDTLLDNVVIDGMCEGIVEAVTRSVTKYNPLPENITISHDNEVVESNAVANMDNKAPSEIIRSFAPRWSLDDVCVEEDAKTQILSALTIIKNKDKLYNQWGLGRIFKQNRGMVLNFYGKPGTGKTMMAEAIASHLGKTVYQVNYAELESKYVGETPKNIVEVFRNAQSDDSVLVFDEADSFLGKRLTSVSQSADYGVNITRSVMLMEIERYEGIVVFTSNLISNYDEAFKRRIYTSVEFNMPDADARTRIWKTHIPNELPLAKDVTSRVLGERYDNISGADIKDMLMSAAASCIQERGDTITLRHFDAACKYIKSRYESGGQFVETKVVKTETLTKEQYEEEMAKAGGAHG